MATTPIDTNSVVTSPGSSGSNTGDETNVKLALQLMDQGKAARAMFDKDWSKRWQYYHGDQWSAEKTSLYKSKPVQNIIRQTIQAQLPILTDQRPGFSVLPRDPSDWEFSQLLGEIIDAYWDDNSLDHTLIEVLMDTMVLDAGILKCSWDPDMDNGAGNVRIECVNPEDIFVPYGATDFTKNCPWVIHRSFKTVGELKRLFPDQSEYIKPDAGQGDDRRSEMSTRQTDDIKLVSPIDQYSPPGMGGTGGGADHRKVTEVWEIWMDDDSIEEIELDSGEKVTKKKYPNGKLITILPNQKHELQCVNSPYKHERKPFIRFVDHILPRQFWGEGEAKQLMQQQRMINRALAHLFDIFNLMSNPMWIVEADAGIDPREITNQIASVLTTSSGGINKIRRDFAPAMQSGAIDLYNMIQENVNQTSGISEVSQGRRPPGVTAAAALETLQEAANTRIRLKERNMQVSLQQLGYQIIGLMLQYYTEPRVARITNKQGWPRYFEFFIDDYSEQGGGYVINKKEFEFDENQGTYVAPMGYEQSPESKGMMDVKVLSGTAMPWQKTSRANIAFRLFDAGAIDTSELLKALEWPNADKIAERLAQQQGQAGPGGPPPAPGGPPPAPGGPPPAPGRIPTAGGG